MVLLGAGVLLLDAALMVCFAPRPLGELRRAAAALPLVVLAIVPSTLVRPQLAYLHGLILFALLAAFMWGDRIPRYDAPLAVGIAALAGAAAMIAAPALDRAHAVVQLLRRSPAASRPATSSRSTGRSATGRSTGRGHGREVLDVQAEQPDYWKAENLDLFNGTGWAPRVDRLRGGAAATGAGCASPSTEQTIQVTLRAMRTSDVIGAGFSFSPQDLSQPVVPGVGARDLDCDHPAAAGRQLPDRHLLAAADRCPARRSRIPLPLGRAPGRSHDRALAARPSRRAGPVRSVRLQQPAAGHGQCLRKRRHRHVEGIALRQCLRARPPPRQARRDAVRIRQASDGATSRTATSTTRIRRRAPTRSRASCSATRSATASSSRARWRCCCGWAGFRRASRPASRPAPTTSHATSTSSATSTRTPGSRHGFPAYGWVRFDPTPASAPARGGHVPLPTLHGGQLRGAAVDRTGPQSRSRRRSTAPSTVTSHSGGTSIVPIVDRAGGARRVARARAPQPGPLHRARRRRAGRRARTRARTMRATGASRRDAGGARAPLSRLAGGGAVRPRDPPAALRRRRASCPTAAQRRALRRQLRFGLGALGRLRALWALPPRWRLLGAGRREGRGPAIRVRALNST